MNFNEFSTISGIAGMIIGAFSFIMILAFKLYYNLVGDLSDLPTYLSSFIFVIGLIIVVLSIEEGKENE